MALVGERYVKCKPVIWPVKSYVIRDLDKHRIVHHELHDVSLFASHLTLLLGYLRHAWLSLKYDGLRYEMQTTSYNSISAFRNENPGLGSFQQGHR